MKTVKFYENERLDITDADALQSLILNYVARGFAAIMGPVEGLSRKLRVDYTAWEQQNRVAITGSGYVFKTFNHERTWDDIVPSGFKSVNPEVGLTPSAYIHWFDSADSSQNTEVDFSLAIAGGIDNITDYSIWTRRVLAETDENTRRFWSAPNAEEVTLNVTTRRSSVLEFKADVRNNHAQNALDGWVRIFDVVGNTGSEARTAETMPNNVDGPIPPYAPLFRPVYLWDLQRQTQTLKNSERAETTRTALGTFPGFHLGGAGKYRFTEDVDYSHDASQPNYYATDNKGDRRDSGREDLLTLVRCASDPHGIASDEDRGFLGVLHHLTRSVSQIRSGVDFDPNAFRPTKEDRPHVKNTNNNSVVQMAKRGEFGSTLREHNDGIAYGGPQLGGSTEFFDYYSGMANGAQATREEIPFSSSNIASQRPLDHFTQFAHNYGYAHPHLLLSGYIRVSCRHMRRSGGVLYGRPSVAGHHGRKEWSFTFHGPLWNPLGFELKRTHDADPDTHHLLLNYGPYSPEFYGLAAMGQSSLTRGGSPHSGDNSDNDHFWGMYNFYDVALELPEDSQSDNLHGDRKTAIFNVQVTQGNFWASGMASTYRYPAEDADKQDDTLPEFNHLGFQCGPRGANPIVTVGRTHNNPAGPAGTSAGVNPRPGGVGTAGSVQNPAIFIKFPGIEDIWHRHGDRHPGKNRDFPRPSGLYSIGQHVGGLRGEGDGDIGGGDFGFPVSFGEPGYPDTHEANNNNIYASFNEQYQPTDFYIQVWGTSAEFNFDSVYRGDESKIWTGALDHYGYEDSTNAGRSGNAAGETPKHGGFGQSIGAPGGISATRDHVHTRNPATGERIVSNFPYPHSGITDVTANQTFHEHARTLGDQRPDTLKRYTGAPSLEYLATDNHGWALKAQPLNPHNARGSANQRSQYSNAGTGSTGGGGGWLYHFIDRHLGDQVRHGELGASPDWDGGE